MLNQFLKGFAEFANLSGVVGRANFAKAGRVSSIKREKASRLVRTTFVLERI